MKIDNTLIPGLASAPAGQSPDAVGDSGEFALAMDQATVAASPPDPGAITLTMNGEEANPIQPIAAGQTLDLLQSQIDLAPSQVVSPTVSAEKVETLLNATQIPIKALDVPETDSSLENLDLPVMADTDEETPVVAEQVALLLSANLAQVQLPTEQVSEVKTEVSTVTASKLELGQSGTPNGSELIASDPELLSQSELLGRSREGQSDEFTEVLGRGSRDQGTIQANSGNLEQAPAPESLPTDKVLVTGLTKNSNTAPKQELDSKMLSGLGLTEMVGEHVDSPISVPIVATDKSAIIPTSSEADVTTPIVQSAAPVPPVKVEAMVSAATSTFSPVQEVGSEVAIADQESVTEVEDPRIKSEEQVANVGQSVVRPTSTGNSTFANDDSSKEDNLFETTSVESKNLSEVGFQDVITDVKKVEQTASAQKVSELPKETQQEVMQQTVDRIEKMAMHRPISVMTVRLMPEELGAITVQIKTMGNKSDAEITATNERVVQALEANRPQLVQAIEARGAGLSEMSLKHDASANQQGQQGTQQEAERNQNFANNVPLSNLPGQAVVSTEGNWNPTGTKSLNMVI